MSRLTPLLLALAFSSCSAPVLQDEADAVVPKRIISLDYCADQYVLKFAAKDHILAVSPDAAKDFSYMRDTARGVPTVRPVAEEVLLLKPDLIVRSYGGGPGATRFYEQAGIPVLDVGWASDLPSVLANTQRIADELGAHERGVKAVVNAKARLEALSKTPKGKTILYMTPSGVTTGPGSLVHELIVAAGLENFQKEAGWRPLPLERLAYEQPDLIAAAFFDAKNSRPDAWSAMNHPVARAQLKRNSVIPLNSAWTSCNGWYLIEGVEALSEGASE